MRAFEDVKKCERSVQYLCSKTSRVTALPCIRTVCCIVSSAPQTNASSPPGKCRNCAPGLAGIKFMLHYMQHSVVEELIPLNYVHIYNTLDEPDKTYYRTSREATLKKQLEVVCCLLPAPLHVPLMNDNDTLTIFLHEIERYRLMARLAQHMSRHSLSQRIAAHYPRVCLSSSSLLTGGFVTAVLRWSQTRSGQRSLTSF